MSASSRGRRQSAQLDQMEVVPNSQSVQVSSAPKRLTPLFHRFRGFTSPGPDGRRASYLRDGRIVRWQDYWNPFTVLVALGGTISFPH